MSKLLALDFGDDNNHQEFAIDIRDSAINWMNDLERDPKYNRWSTSLMELLRPTFPGMIRQIRRNLYSLVSRKGEHVLSNAPIELFLSKELLFFTQVVIIDPTDPENYEILKLIESFVIHTAPIRVGLVLNVSDSHSLNGLQDAGVAMQCVLNYVAQVKDPATALGSLRTIMKEAKERVTVEDVKEYIRKEHGEDPHDILGIKLR